MLGLGIQIYIFNCVNPNTMSKLLSVTLIAAALLTSTQHLSPTFAGTCASKCGSPPLQFTPGKHIRLQVLNSTPRIIKLEKIRGTNAITLQPGQKLQLDQGDGTEPNVSLVFWDDTGLSLQAIVSKANFATLRVELRPTWRFPGDRSVDILDDGRVNVF